MADAGTQGQGCRDCPEWGGMGTLCACGIAKGKARQAAEAGPEGTLEQVFQDARAVFLVGVPPGQRGDAQRALAGFLSRAQAVGYRDGQAAGPKPTTLEELLADEDGSPLTDDVRKELYDAVDEARRGGGIEGGIDYTLRNLESVVEEAIKEARR